MRPPHVPSAALAAPCFVLLVALLAPAVARAQGQPPQPVGDPFLVPADPAGEQYNGNVARSADGSFIVVWEDEPWIESNERNIHARRFDAQGQPRGAGYRINVEPVHRYVSDEPQVAVTPSGGFIVAWGNSDPAPHFDDVYARVYDADALPLGPPFLASEDSADSQYLVGIAVDPAGQFVVAWNDYYYYYDPVGARVFEADGTPRTGDLLLDTADGSYLSSPAIAASGPGEFVVGYSVYDWYPSYVNEVRAQKFDIDGNITIPEFRVDQGSGSSYYGQQVEIGSDAGGNFTVLWNTGYGGSGVVARRFSPNAQPLGDEFVVGDGSNRLHLAVSPGGRSLVYWEHSYSGGELQAQLWAPDGTPEGPPFDVVDPAVPGRHLRAALDASESPLFVFHLWQLNQGNDVLARRFQTFERIFLDGFESGDMTGWSEVMN